MNDTVKNTKNTRLPVINFGEIVFSRNAYYLITEVFFHIENCLAGVRVIMYELVALKAGKVERMSLSASHYSNAQWTHQEIL